MPLKTSFDEQLAQLKSVFGAMLCRVTGHNRSGGAAFEADDDWYSHCERCDRPLRRVAPRNWREITSEQFETAKVRRQEELQAFRSPPVGRKRNRAKRPARRPKQA